MKEKIGKNELGIAILATIVLNILIGLIGFYNLFQFNVTPGYMLTVSGTVIVLLLATFYLLGSNKEPQIVGLSTLITLIIFNILQFLILTNNIGLISINFVIGTYTLSTFQSVLIWLVQVFAIYIPLQYSDELGF